MVALPVQDYDMDMQLTFDIIQQQLDAEEREKQHSSNTPITETVHKFVQKEESLKRGRLSIHLKNITNVGQNKPKTSAVEIKNARQDNIYEGVQIFCKPVEETDGDCKSAKVPNDLGEGHAPLDTPTPGRSTQLATGHKQRVKGVNAKPHKKPRTNKASGDLAADLQPDRSPLADNGPDFNGEVIESNESERTLHASLIKLLQDMSRLTKSSEITPTEASDHLSNVNYEEYRVPPPSPVAPHTAEALAYYDHYLNFIQHVEPAEPDSAYDPTSPSSSVIILSSPSSDHDYSATLKGIEKRYYELATTPKAPAPGCSYWEPASLDPLNNNIEKPRAAATYVIGTNAQGCSQRDPALADSSADINNKTVNSDEGAIRRSPHSNINPTLIDDPNSTDNSELAHKTVLLTNIKEMQKSIKQVKAMVSSIILKHGKAKNKNRALNDVLEEINHTVKMYASYVVSDCESAATNLMLIPL
ncbi:hypothetical protein NDU88_004554 [Pleurodeles waltl]|uniref:Uncharacterized protein n=1 Tax=Pleurodeles waltl TaxID=8319 RepID=A0AAV7NLD9_PLEWA|nr:hypothetical protein NDU88_004554 [Pleurodeles waltl]